MQTVGVICEYNPFHLGHARQLSLIRQQLEPETAIVCLMSGNYVQRGEPAILTSASGHRRRWKPGLVSYWNCRSHTRCARQRASPQAVCTSYRSCAAAFSASAANPGTEPQFPRSGSLLLGRI